MESPRKPFVFALAVTLVATGIAVADELTAANEAAAIGALRRITTSQAIFREGDKEQDGNLDYGMLSELSNTGLIDFVLGSGTKQGYLFEAGYSPTTSEFLWYGIANPRTPGKTGKRSFYTNQAGVIYSSDEPITLTPEQREKCEAPSGLTPVGRDEGRQKPAHPEPEQGAPLDKMACLAGASGAHMLDDAEPGQIYVCKGSEGGTIEIRSETRTKETKRLIYSFDAASGGSPREYVISPHGEDNTWVSLFKRRLVGKETLEVSGVAFDCEVQDLRANEGSKHAKAWISKRFPYVLKLVDADDQERTILELVEIKGPSRTKLAAECACGAKFEEGSRFCSKCGKERPAAPKGEAAGSCSACIASCAADARFCPRCGKERKKD